MNSRNFTRVDYTAGASVRYENKVIACHTNNLSLRGIYLDTDYEIPLDIPVHVTVFHQNQPAFKVNAKVIRKEGNGVGLQIHNLNVNSFVKLRKIITDNSADQVAVMQETFKMLKCIY